MGSFAAAVGAMIAGIFGMNMRNTMENSSIGFWGTTTIIILLCLTIYFSILKFTKNRKAL